MDKLNISELSDFSKITVKIKKLTFDSKFDYNIDDLVPDGTRQGEALTVGEKFFLGELT